jgi:hypothetical protein
VVLLAAGAMASFGVSSGSATGSPVTIGASLSLSGDFSTDGQAFERGYQLWAADQNKKGGLLGHPIKLDIISDASQPAQVITNYNKLIGSDHDAFVLGPFSTLLTVPASKVAARYDYAFVEGAGGAPAAFGNGLKNVFDVSVPVALNLTAFAKWVASLPPSQRPKTAAYPTSNDPFTEPQLPPAQKILEAAGIKTVYSTVFPAEVTDFTPIAGQIAAKKPDVVVLGSVDVPTVSAFIHTFVPAALQPEDLHRDRRPRPGRRVREGGRNRQRERDLRAERVVRRLAQGRQHADGQGVHREVRGNPLRGERRRRRGVLRRPGADAGRAGDEGVQQREDHRLPALGRHPQQRPRVREVRLQG